MIKTLLITFLLATFCSTGFAQNRQGIERVSLKQQLASAKDDTARVDFLYSIAFSYVFGYPDTAIIYAKQGLELSKKIDYKKGESTGLSILSSTLTVAGNFTGALHYGFENLALSQQMNDSSLLINAYDDLMICYREQEDYKEALKFGFKAFNLLNYQKVEIYLKVLTIGFISSVYEKSNQLDSALYYGTKALEFSKTFNWAGLYLTLGNIYSKSGKKELALDYYRKGIAIAEEQFIYIDLVDIYNKMSIEYEIAGKRDSSFYYANKSISIEGVHSYPEGELRAVTQLAHLYEIQGAKDSTIKYLKQSAALTNSLFSRQKTREAQSLAFNEKIQQQELTTQKQMNENKIKMYVLVAFIIGSLLIAFFLWRNNRHKQKANALLHTKNIEIQSTLTTLKATQYQLIQKEKMASLGELTAGIAHEIQNPLNFVNNFSEVNTELIDELEQEADKGNLDEVKAIAKDIKENEQKINHHGKRADAIVKGMLQHSQSSSGIKELTDINKLTDEYLRLAYHGVKAKDKTTDVILKTDFDESIGNIDIIPQDIGRVLLNLYNNAFYAVAEKKNASTVFPKESEQPYEPTVSVTTKKMGDHILIRVADNGIGIPQKVVDKIFQPFFTTKPTGQGTGLGLSLAYDIVKAHGGELKVETREGEETTFIITL